MYLHTVAGFVKRETGQKRKAEGGKRKKKINRQGAKDAKERREARPALPRRNVLTRDEGKGGKNDKKVQA